MDLGRVDRRGGDGVDPGLAQRAVVAPRRVAAGRALCLLSATLTLNLWVGYFPTVQTAWNQLTSGPLPDQADQAAVAALAHSGVRPSHGTLLPVVIPSDASHFKHRGELVYLPPAWFDRASFEPSAAAAADGDDDRRSIQHTRRLGASR